jgi:ribosome maturation factor RimP
MMKRRIEDVVQELALPIVEKLDFEFVDVEFIKEGANWYLRVYIDKPGGILIDDCKAVSKQLSDQLDVADPIKQSYIFEVSSPGLERPLKKESDFVRFKGEEVEVKLFQAVDGKKVYEGELLGMFDNLVGICHNGTEFKFDRENIAVVRRVIKF